MNTEILLVDMMPVWFWALATALFGLAIGSFLNVVICRVPEERSIVTPGSACPKCGHKITPLENIPILSYLMLRGRCRGCGKKISLIYPFIEALTAVGFLLAFWKQLQQPTFNIAEMIADMAFISANIALICIDFEHMILPNVITLPGSLVALVIRLFVPTQTSPEASFYATQFAIIILLMLALFACLRVWGSSNLFRVLLIVLLSGFIIALAWLNTRALDWYIDLQINFQIFWEERLANYPMIVSLINGLLGAIIGAGILVMLREAYFVFRNIEGMGLGDVKMMLMVGFYLGWQLTIGTLILASLLGTLLALVFLLRQGREALQVRIPFGVFLGIAAILLTLYGQPLLSWYVRLMVINY
ncbi:MAG: prepilin peptidase [Acidobacteriota bacterium]